MKTGSFLFLVLQVMLGLSEGATSDKWMSAVIRNSSLWSPYVISENVSVANRFDEEVVCAMWTSKRWWANIYILENHICNMYSAKTVSTGNPNSIYKPVKCVSKLHDKVSACSGNFKLIPGVGCFWYDSGYRTWDAARSFCNSQGAELPFDYTLTLAVLQNITNTMGLGVSFWVGATGLTASLAWVSGAPMNKTSLLWYTYQPDRPATILSCIDVEFFSGPLFTDRDCTITATTLCEIPGFY